MSLALSRHAIQDLTGFVNQRLFTTGLRMNQPVLLLALAIIALTWQAAAGDWPQWRFDANRSGATEEAGPASPALQWTLDLPRPDPAYDHQYRMCADETYAPVAAQGLLFIPSNVEDQLIACDLATGQVKWRFTAEGPVRFAPVVWQGKVYFGADDGYLYCANAAYGRILWKVRGAPETAPDCRMMVNSRMCSRWPVRGAPVLSGGVVYFGAGVWSEEGAYVIAVDAATGKTLWRKDSLSYIHNGMSDHGRAFDLGLPPQGYLAVIDGKVAVPSGRALAAWFDPATGEMEPYTCFYVKFSPPRGTWQIFGAGRYCVQGGNWFGTRADALPPIPPEMAQLKSGLSTSKPLPDNEKYVMENRPFFNTDTYKLHVENSYTEPILTRAAAYISEYEDDSKYLVERSHTLLEYPAFDRIVARDLTHPRWTSFSLAKKGRAKGGGNDELRKMEFPILWELKSPLRVLIKAGPLLYAGGEGKIAAIAIPAAAGETPKVVWEAEVVGVPVNALVADGRLVVSTSSGAIYGFGSGAAASTVPPVAAKPSAPYVTPKNGYALVLGWDGGKDSEALARDGQTGVVVFEPDEAKAAEARAYLAGKGLYGRRAQVIHYTPGQTQLAPYWASLVLPGSLAGFGASPQAALALALDCLRPYTGRMPAPSDPALAGALRDSLAGRTGYTVKTEEKGAVVCRTAPPDGADDWTHESGGPGNRFASSDHLVKWPLGLLWYSGDVDRYFTPMDHLQSAGFQHTRNPYPLVSHGRMFILVLDSIHCIDIYTGAYLWKATMPATPAVKLRYYDARLYGRDFQKNYIAAPDLVYAVLEEEIIAYDAETGEQRFTIPIPDEIRREEQNPQWTETRLWNDNLFAVLGQTLVAVDRHSGKLVWKRKSTQESSTFAIGDDTVFGIDYRIAPVEGGDDRLPMQGNLFAIRAATGEPLWAQTAQYPPLPKFTASGLRDWSPPVAPTVAYNDKHKLVVLTANRNCVFVHDAGTGALVWSKEPDSVPKKMDYMRLDAPVVTDDYLLLSRYNGYFAYLFNIATGESAGDDTGIPSPRTCARILGDNDMMVYRDSTTELYDIDANRMVGFNSVRSGCTTSFIPAGGVMAAPMLGHGCVCNYPMFSSVGLYHMPESDAFRPAIVTASWGKQGASDYVEGNKD